MANPNGNPQNLIPNPERTPEQLSEMGKAGGTKSGEVRREKKRMSEIYSAFLSKKFKVKDDTGNEVEIVGGDMVLETIAKIVHAGGAPSVPMIKELREGVDGNMLDVEVMDLTKGMTHNQKKARINELLGRKPNGE